MRKNEEKNDFAALTPTDTEVSAAANAAKFPVRALLEYSGWSNPALRDLA